MKEKAVLFDFDYTLGDATESILVGCRYGLEKLGWPEPTDENVKKTIGYSLEDGYTMLTGDRDAENKKRFAEFFREKSHPIQVETAKLFPGALELLKALKDAGILTAVVSTKADRTLLGVLDKTGASQYLQFAIGSSCLTRVKPDPEGILLALKRLGLKPEETLYCGDTVMDAEAAFRAGCGFCAVLNGTTPAEDFEKWPVRHIAKDLSDLKSWLGV